MRKIKVILSILLMVMISTMVLTPDLTYADEQGTRQGVVNIDRYMLDPLDDVKIISTNNLLTPASGYDFIDITSLRSYHPENELGIINELELTLEVSVYGQIMDDSDLHYMIFIDADSEDYLIDYNNGSAEGQSLEDPFGPSFNVQARTENTNTLVLTTNIFNIGNPRDSFEWSCLGLLLNEDTSDNQYMDKAPDKLLKITEPTDQATVHSTITVTGIVENSVVDIESIEYQVDSKFEGTWEPAEDDSDDWKRWSFEFDTTRIKDGAPHEFNVRGFDGERYYEDTITLYVVQSNKDNPEKVENLPAVNVGDIYQYTSTQDPSYLGIEVELITDLTEKIAGLDTVEIEGTSYDVYIRELTGQGVITYANIPIEFTMDGEVLITRDNYALLKQEEEININVPLIGSLNEASTSYFEPPLDSFDFPMTIGEKWSATGKQTSTTVIRFSGDYAEDKSTDNVEYAYEALHTEVTEVPAGSYNTFVFRSQQEGSDIYSLNYYSPELGNYVRTESYDSNRELLDRIELEEYVKGSGGYVKIHEVIISPTEPKADDKVTFQVKLENTGTANLTGIKIELDINRNGFTSKLMDIGSQATIDLTFTWTPKEEGEYNIEIYSPDDDWFGKVIVSKADKSSPFDLFSTPLSMALFIIIIIIIVLIVIFISRKKRESEQPLYEPPPQTGPSIFDPQPPEGQGLQPQEGRLHRPGKVTATDEPQVKIIKYTSRFDQVGNRQPQKRPGAEDDRQK